LYGKDITCPAPWVDYVHEVIPEFLHSLGSSDMLAMLPKELQPENFMIYVGHHGTNTPAHTDICASVGHNVMVSADPDASAFWFMTKSDDRQQISDFFNTEGGSVFSENFLCPVEVLKKSPVPVYVIEQKLGDFVIVPPLSVHQVVNKGGFNTKVSWNRMTEDSLRRCVDFLPTYRANFRPEIYRTKAMTHFALLHKTRQAQ
ncbi:hypothetical protein BDK51DRAFT_9852, partial [Blyttiomyces helicus]